MPAPPERNGHADHAPREQCCRGATERISERCARNYHGCPFEQLCVPPGWAPPTHCSPQVGHLALQTDTKISTIAAINFLMMIFLPMMSE